MISTDLRAPSVPIAPCDFCRFPHAPDARGKTSALVARAPSPGVMTKPRATPGTPPTGGGAAPRDFQDHLRASPSPTSPPLAQTLKDVGDVNDERVVLLPVDGGRGIETDAVLKWCCDNLYRDGDTFLLLHVVPRSGWRRRAREDALGYEPSEVSSVVVVVFARETYPRPIRGAFSLAPSEEPGWGAILPESVASPEEEKPKTKTQNFLPPLVPHPTGERRGRRGRRRVAGRGRGAHATRVPPAPSRVWTPGGRRVLRG